jgi:hypothetical protein
MRMRPALADTQPCFVQASRATGESHWVLSLSLAGSRDSTVTPNPAQELSTMQYHSVSILSACPPIAPTSPPLLHCTRSKEYKMIW